MILIVQYSIYKYIELISMPVINIYKICIILQSTYNNISQKNILY